MTGPRDGVIGVKKEQAIESLVTQMHVRFDTAEDDPWLNGVVIRCSGPLRAQAIEQVLVPWSLLLRDGRRRRPGGRSARSARPGAIHTR